MGWLHQHAPILNLFVSVSMLVVWIIYLQLFLRNYQRQLRANIVISRGAGSGLDASCCVTNMSAEAVFIEGIVIYAEIGDETPAYVVTPPADLGPITKDPRSPSTQQGPLKSSEVLNIGSFGRLANLALGEDPDHRFDDLKKLTAVVAWVIADFGTENMLVFVRRRFLIATHAGRSVIRLESLESKRVKSRREQAHVRRILQEHLEHSAHVARDSTRHRHDRECSQGAHSQ